MFTKHELETILYTLEGYMIGNDDDKLCDELSPRFPDRKYIFTPSWRGFTRRFSIPKKFAHQTYCSGPDFFQEHVNRLIKVWKKDFNGEGRELFTTSSG